MVESVGNAPTSACLQGKCIACLPRPHGILDWRFLILDLAGRRGAAPRPLGFGDPAARLVRGLTSKIANRKSKTEWCGCREWASQALQVRCPQETFASRTAMHPDNGSPQGPPWRRDILLLNHNREIKRAGGVIAPPARAISTKN
jgi:hypothetical protein